MLDGGESAGEEGDADHDEKNAEPAGEGDGFVENEDGGKETEDVADADERIREGKGIVAEDVEPDEGGGEHGEAGGRKVPNGKDAAEEGEAPGEGAGAGEGELEEDLAADEEEALEGGEGEELQHAVRRVSV